MESNGIEWISNRFRQILNGSAQFAVPLAAHWQMLGTMCRFGEQCVCGIEQAHKQRFARRFARCAVREKRFSGCCHSLRPVAASVYAGLPVYFQFAASVCTFGGFAGRSLCIRVYAVLSAVLWLEHGSGTCRARDQHAELAGSTLNSAHIDRQSEAGRHWNAAATRYRPARLFDY